MQKGKAAVELDKVTMCLARLPVLYTILTCPCALRQYLVFLNILHSTSSKQLALYCLQLALYCVVSCWFVTKKESYNISSGGGYIILVKKN